MAASARPGGIVPNPPNIQRSPALVTENGGGINGAILAAVGERRHDGSDGVLATNSGQQEWPPMRCTPSLQAPQGPLVDFLTSGYGYDDSSVASAVRLGNEHFSRRELGRAIDFYGAAYEIGRLHFDYKPLMHDLVMRRVICYSMLGDLQQAMLETELALRVVPNSATALLYQGLIFAKMANADEANRHFQMSVAQCRELRNVVDCLVALFMLAQGHCDRAIQVCSQVLERQPRFPFALLVRGDAYKFHASGYFSGQAAEDYTLLLEIDIGLQPLIGELLTPQQHSRFDEMVLCFHPRLMDEGPRPYDDYPMCAVYRKRRPFLVAAFVLFATAKLKTCVRSTQLVQNVEKRNEELLLARAAAERKVRQLVETQQKLAALEASSFSEVWGPADPDHTHVRKYRRYWMERPLGFPRRKGGKGSESGDDCSPPHTARSISPPPPGQVESPGMHFIADTSFGGSLSLSMPASPMPTAEHQPRAFHPPSGDSTIQPPSPMPPQASRLSPGDAPVLLFSPGPQVAASSAREFEESSKGNVDNPLRHLTAALGTPEAPQAAQPVDDEPPAPMTADVLLDAAEPRTPPHPAAVKRSKEEVYAARPPPQKLGQDWDDSQWLAKAFELADTFADIGHAVGGAAAAPVAAPRSPRAVPPVAPCDTKMRLPGGKVAYLAEEIEKHGVDIIPDWFTPLDRIYEVCDMTYFHVEPEPLAAAPGLAGAPGYSYVVPKTSRHGRPRGHFVGSGGGGGARLQGDAGDAALFNSEALLRRYQNRIVHTSLPSTGGGGAR